MSTETRNLDIYEEIARLRRQGQRAALATIIQIRGSVPSFETAKILVREDGSTVGTVGGGCVENDVWKAARQVMFDEKPRRLVFDLTDSSNLEAGLICGGKVEIFVEPILAVPTAYVFGAGHISKFISKAATLAGFHTVIIDDRPQYANRERFPEAVELYSDSFESAFAKIVPNEFSYLVIVTRGHLEDQNVLRWAVKTKARFIGMIGSRFKKRALFANLREEGISQEQLDRVFSPVGVDIHAILPEEIAISIVAQMVAVRRSKPGTYLPQPETSGESS
ncbi:MAG: xanthine dehydrogenase [Acidimicrobiia bacterium]|nr:xanthine dehydrogenase [Acidimicrobiia bacterium]